MGEEVKVEATSTNYTLTFEDCAIQVTKYVGGHLHITPSKGGRAGMGFVFQNSDPLRVSRIAVLLNKAAEL